MRLPRKNYVFAFILGGLLFGSIGVIAATQISANNISYKNTTVDQVLDGLYEKANKMTLGLRTESYSRNYAGTTNYSLDTGSLYISNKYSYFKITGVSVNENLREYGIYGHFISTSSSGPLQQDTEYSLSDIDNIWVVAYSKTDGQMGYVIPTIEFYNK